MSFFFTLDEKELEANHKLQKEYQEYTSHFAPEELTILAITGANGFCATKGADAPLWHSDISLTAWMEEGNQEIHQGKFFLEALASDKLYKHLRTCVPHDCIIKCKVRLSKGGSFLLLNIPEPAFEPRLESILNNQQKPIMIQVEDIATFILDRKMDWFFAEVDWLGTQIILSFEQDEEEPAEMEKAQKVLQILMKNKAEWDQRIRNLAADKLLETANVWAEDGEETPVSREQFLMRMKLDSIDVDPDGSFSFWFDDDDMFWGHVIHVTGDVEKGPKRACIEG